MTRPTIIAVVCGVFFLLSNNIVEGLQEASATAAISSDDDYDDLGICWMPPPSLEEDTCDDPGITVDPARHLQEEEQQQEEEEQGNSNRRKLWSQNDFFFAGHGTCNVDAYDYRSTHYGTTSPSWTACMNECGDGNGYTGFSFDVDRWTVCVFYWWGWWWHSGWCYKYETRYSLQCRCHKDGVVTGVKSGTSDWDCYGYVFGDSSLGDLADRFFYIGAGPCVGSKNSQQFSHFEIAGTIDSDADCAHECSAEDARTQGLGGHGIVGFSRHLGNDKCYCQFQLDSGDYTIDYDGSGIGGPKAGSDNDYNCWGHYQTSNQIVTRRHQFQYLGKGPCRDTNHNRFPHFQLNYALTADTEYQCGQLCVWAYPGGITGTDGVVGFSRNQDTSECYCHHDFGAELPVSLDGFPRSPAYVGTGDVVEGRSEEFSCHARVAGSSGFNFIGIGRCRDSSGNLFPHFRMSASATHGDAHCAEQCLDLFPQGITGFSRHKENLQCYCAYSTGTTPPSGYTTYWTGEGGTGTVTAGTADEYVYSCYAVDDTSPVTECPTHSGLETNLDEVYYKELESWCNCDNGNGKNIYELGESCNCTRPYNWCTELGEEYSHLDCDGDGTLDSMCTLDGSYRALLSSNACDEEKGSDASTVCPAFNCSAPVGCTAGSEYYSLDCDGDGAKDGYCVNGGTYWMTLSSDGCAEATGSTGDGACPAFDGCTRPDDWCTDPGNMYFFIDCDGDGALDSMCKTGESSYLFRISGDGSCVEQSDTSVNTLCPVAGCVRPSPFCGHRGSQYHYVDCDGDGKLDSHCRDRRGNTWTHASLNNCMDTGDRCPAADFCTQRTKSCNHAGSHFYSVDPNQGDDNANSDCRNEIGKNAQDTLCYRPLTSVHEDRAYILNNS